MSSTSDRHIPRLSERQRQTPPSHRRFSAEFKADTVRLVLEHGYSAQAAADAVGASHTSVCGWVRAAKRARDRDDTHTTEVGDASAEALRQLRREVEQLRLENAILKKATAYFAKDQL